ncbi:MAG: hypothetical protein IKR97_04680, partial [Eubacterium sp.]|nr:hypothetical protein [Eubacterium sp.]
MKASKKILSLFLALVMVVSTCSVGFTAFAADGNKTDKNAAYWNNNVKADEAFDAVTALINNYVPALANGALKSTLEGLGMTVDENTSLEDIVAGVSPALMKLLGAKGNKEQIIKNYYQEIGYSASKAESTYKNFSALGLYDYLDDADATMDFYALYQFCLDNINSSDSKKKEFAETNLPKLKALLQKHLDAYDEVFSEPGGSVKGTAALKAYKKTVEDAGKAISEYTLEELENFEIGGVKLKDVNKTDKSCDTKIAYDNMYLDFEGAPFQIDNIASALYFQAHEEYVMGIFYLYLANLGGATVKYNGTAITPSNYKEVIGKPTDAECLQAVYDTIFDGSTAASKQDGTGEFASPYYSAIAIGAIEATKSYDTSAYKSAKEFVDAQMITDDQIKDLYNFRKNTGNSFNDYLKSDGCKFSEYAKRFLSEFPPEGSTLNQDIDLNLDNCSDEDAAVTMFKRFTIADEFEMLYGGFIPDDGDAIMFYYIDKVYPSDDATPVFDIVKEMLPAVIIQQYQGKTDADFGFYGTVNVKFFYEDKKVGKLVKDELGDAAYEYDEYKIPEEMAVEVVNTTINGYLEYLKPGSKYYGIIDGILGELLMSDVDLYNSLYDIWNNLYTEPIETVFNLLPLLVVLVDEVVVPMVFNDKTAAESDLYTILVSGLGEGGGIPAIKALAQENGNTTVGIGNLAFDLNKVIPSILNWLLGNDAEAIAIVGTYTEYAPGVDTSVPVFTNIYVADKALAGARLNGGLEKVLKNGILSGDPELAKAIDEAVTEIASFALDAVNTYLAAHGDDIRCNVKGKAAQKGLNNIFVALPELLDIMGKKYVAKYNVDSDWTLSYKIANVEHSYVNPSDHTQDKTWTQKENTVLNGFKALATENDASKVLEYFVNVLIGEWINPIISIVNDTLADPNNKITSELPLVQQLIDAIGGIGEKSILTDIVNGLFQLKRCDDASFTLKKRANGLVGFSNESGMFLLSNILYKDAAGKEKGLIPFITTLIKADQGSANYKVNNVLKSNGPLLANSKKSSVGTDYSELLTPENK